MNSNNKSLGYQKIIDNNPIDVRFTLNLIALFHSQKFTVLQYEYD